MLITLLILKVLSIFNSITIYKNEQKLLGIIYKK